FYDQLNETITHCTNTIDASATLDTNSFNVDTDNGYMEFAVNLTLPIAFDAANAATCMEAFGPAAQPFFQLGRQNVTMKVLYSFVRPSKLPNDPLTGYVPLELAEKDPIRHKYGALEFDAIYRDFDTGLL